MTNQITNNDSAPPVGQVGFRLTEEYRKAILTDQALHGKIAKATGKSWATIYRWANDNDEKLTMLSVLNTIKEHLKLAKTSVLTKQITTKTNEHDTK